MKRPGFWVLFVLVSLGAAGVGVRYFPQAFPIVALDITMNRDQALAAATEGEAAQRQGRPRLADRKFAFALGLLTDRNAAGKLAEVCTMYADVLRARGDDDRAFSFMRMAAGRDFTRLRALLHK